MSDEQQGIKGARRPLRSRGTGWAALVARAALGIGLTPNAISFVGILIAMGGAWAILAAPQRPWLFLIGALAVQLRLLANMLDGMVAVEGGKASPTGPLWNEVPDRVQDSMLLVAAGYAGHVAGLGWLAALLAACCAYVRLLGGTLGQGQDFRGPMAKPHRMAALTLVLVGAFVESCLHLGFAVIPIGLIIIAVGTLLTIGRRLARQAQLLRAAVP